jgi:predicted transcriptional regulator
MLVRTIPIRLADDTIARLDRLAEVLTTRAIGAEASRSSVMRVALQRGIEILEEELDVAPRANAAKKKRK